MTPRVVTCNIVDTDDLYDCPCCGVSSIAVRHDIQCLNGCDLIWTEWGSLDEDASSYPSPCPHVAAELLAARRVADMQGGR